MTDVFLSHIRNTIVRYVTGWGTEPVNATNKAAMESKGRGTQSIVLNVEQFISDIENRPAIWNRNYHCNKSFLEQTWGELADVYKLPKASLKAKWKGLRDNFRVEYKRIPRNEAGEMLIAPEAYESKWTHYNALLFLSDHMRQRNLKNEILPFYFQQSAQCDEDYEETLVEPDITGLITLDDDEDYEEEEDETHRPEKIVNLKDLSVNRVPLQSTECNSNDSAIYSYGDSRSARSYAGSTSTVSTSSSKGGSSVPPPLYPLKRKRSLDENGDVKTQVVELEALNDPDDDYYYLLSLHPYMKQLNASQKLRLRTKIQKLIFKELYKEDIDETK